jgi:hypothetical protein
MVMKLIKLSDLEERNNLYFVGNLVDIQGSSWVSRHFALQILDLVNSEINQPQI